MKRFLLALLCMLLFSCASKPVEPLNDNDSLVVGRVLFKGTGYRNSNTASINGKHYDNIELVFENQTTGKSISVRSKGFLASNKAPGFFYFKGENNSTYELKKLIYKHQVGGSWIKLTTRVRGFVFDISSGKVFNIGKLNWVSSYKKSTRIIQNKSDINSAFAVNYKESNWNKFKWEYIDVYRF